MSRNVFWLLATKQEMNLIVRLMKVSSRLLQNAMTLYIISRPFMKL
jgi:hypothetical protein